ncbi:MAG: PmoA family protein, partial [Verrucomicrobiae bacterium]|nr:PmoA family protein [Verrucomicrobiae bacterium]
VELFKLATSCSELMLSRTGKPSQTVPAQFVPGPRPCTGTLWWLMPPAWKGEQRLQLNTSAGKTPPLVIQADAQGQFYDITDEREPVLRYNFGATAVPAGTGTNYARGDYIHPLYGPDREVLTDDYPKDHPHHRGVWWSWPVTRWRDEVRDIWAVRGVWSRPVAVRKSQAGPVMAILEAENVWKWGDKDPIVREEVLLRVFRRTPTGRCVDVEVKLTALADGVAIGGRPKGGYGGFSLRAAPVEAQTINAKLDPADAKPRRSWIDYSGKFAGGQGVAGVALFEHPSNPGYPSEHRLYPKLNCVMPAFPGEKEVPLARDKPLVLKHRLWIHAGAADEQTLAGAWAAWAMPAKLTISKP